MRYMVQRQSVTHFMHVKAYDS